MAAWLQTPPCRHPAPGHSSAHTFAGTATLGFGGLKTGAEILQQQASRAVVLLRSRLLRIHPHLLLVSPDLLLVDGNRVLYAARPAAAAASCPAKPRLVSDRPWVRLEFAQTPTRRLP